MQVPEEVSFKNSPRRPQEILGRSDPFLPEGRVAVWANFCKHYAYKITSFYRNKEIIPARELGKEQHTVMEEAER